MTNTVGLGAQADSFGGFYNNESGVIIAVIFASIGFFLRPMAVSELHMTYYRKQLSEAGKFNFLAMVVWLPVLAGVMILAFAMKETKVEIPFMSMLQVFLCLMAYWLLADLERAYLSEKMFSATIASFMPLSPNPELSSRERKFGKKFDFERQKIQTTFCRQMYNDVGIYEL